MRHPVIALIACHALSACVGGAEPPPPVAAVASVAIEEVPEQPWRGVIEDGDAAVIDDMSGVWQRVLASVRRANARQAEGEAALLGVDGGLEQPELPPGSYNCRVVRLGNRAGPRRLRSFPPFFCYVKGEADGQLSFTKQTGSDLPGGWLYPDTANRYIFLGARQRQPGENALRYGTDRDRDLFGVVERVGSFRWRMTLPARNGNAIDVYELTPVPVERQAS